VMPQSLPFQRLCIFTTAGQVRDLTREWRSGEVMYTLIRHFVGWALPKQAPEQVR